jgi:hypothetical protein
LIISSPGGIFDAFIDEAVTALSHDDKTSNLARAQTVGRSPQDMASSS